MTGIQQNRLERARRDLKDILARHHGDFKNREIDWKVIKNELGRLEAAFEEQNQDALDQALAKIVSRLEPPNDLRGQIGSSAFEKSQPMPPPVFELLNHIVDKLHFTLESPAEGSSRSQIDKEPDTPDESSCKAK